MPKSVLFDKEEVMRKVTELFWKKGYNGTSMQDLVDVTGLNRSSFYNTFGDKFQLFEESLKYYQKLQDNLTERFLNNSDLSPKQALVSLFKGINQQVIEDPGKGCFFSNCTAELGSVDPKVAKFLASNMESIILLFKTFIEKAQETGEIDPAKNSRQLALFLFSGLQGLRITAMIDQKAEDTVAITDHILSVL